MSARQGESFGLALVSMFGFVFLSGCAQAPVSDIDFVLMEDSGVLVRNPHAEALFRSAIDKAAMLDGPETELLRVLNGYGNFLMRERRCAEAQAVFTRALAIGERHTPESDRFVAHSVNGLTGALAANGQFEQALRMARRDVQVQTELYGPDNTVEAQALGLLGDIELKLGHVAQAEAAYRRCLSILTLRKGNDSCDTIAAMHALAEVCASQDKEPEASLLRRSMMANVELLQQNRHKHFSRY